MQVTFSGPACTDKTAELPSVLNLSLKSKQGCYSFSKEMLTARNTCSIRRLASHMAFFSCAFCFIALLIPSIRHIILTSYKTVHLTWYLFLIFIFSWNLRENVGKSGKERRRERNGERDRESISKIFLVKVKRDPSRNTNFIKNPSYYEHRVN